MSLIILQCYCYTLGIWCPEGEMGVTMFVQPGAMSSGFLNHHANFPPDIFAASSLRYSAA